MSCANGCGREVLQALMGHLLLCREYITEGEACRVRRVLGNLDHVVSLTASMSVFVCGGIVEALVELDLEGSEAECWLLGLATPKGMRLGEFRRVVGKGRNGLAGRGITVVVSRLRQFCTKEKRLFGRGKQRERE